MNIRGTEWCEKNVETIVGWLKVEAEKRNVLFVESVAKLIVWAAIKKSKRSPPHVVATSEPKTFFGFRTSKN